MTRLLLISYIAYHALTHGFDPRVVAAQVFVESSFRPQVVNHGCYGLMQVSLKTWGPVLGVTREDLLDPWTNLWAGTTILRHYLDKSKGDIWRALWLYNNGYKGKNNKYVPQVRKAYKLLYGRDYEKTDTSIR